MPMKSSSWMSAMGVSLSTRAGAAPRRAIGAVPARRPSCGSPRPGRGAAETLQTLDGAGDGPEGSRHRHADAPLEVVHGGGRLLDELAPVQPDEVTRALAQFAVDPHRVHVGRLR